MMFGEDFFKARLMWLYPQQPMQSFWRAIGFFILLFSLFLLMQTVCGLLVFHYRFGGDLLSLGQLGSVAQGGNAPDGMSNPQMVQFMKSMVIGMFPAGLPVAVLALWLAQFGLPSRGGKLPLEWPKIGILGWVLLLISFAIFMGLVFNLLFTALGIDPATYETSAKGLADAKSNAGLVEKTLADLAQDPLLFAFAMPGVIIAAPLAEELMFRGALFAGIANSKLGRPGAVLITAALWAFAHGGAAPLMFIAVLFIMGIVLGLLLLRFGSLWVTIACHTAWNALSTIAMFSAGTHT